MAGLLRSLVCSILITFSTHLYSQKFWLTTYEFPYGPKTAISLTRDTCLFVGFQSGVLRSFDQGHQFEPTLTSSFIYSLFSSSLGRVYAGGAGKIFRSDNLGESWDSTSINSVCPVLQIIENTSGELFAITGASTSEEGSIGGGVYFSNDHGFSWTQRKNGLGIYTDCEHILSDKNGRIYLTVADEYITGNGGLFISDNKGLNWEHIAVNIDGQNAIDNHIKVATTSGLSVSPSDSIYLSVEGIAVNVSVRLNIRKSIHDIRNNSFWQPFKVSNSSIWWLDKALNNIYFSKNGDRYSSHSNSINQGGTFFLKNKADGWLRIDYGLGANVYNTRSSQCFAETSKGKIFMIQLLDERVYWTDTSEVSSINPEKYSVQDISVTPNLIKKGDKVSVHVQEEFAGSKVSVFNLSGNLIHSEFTTKQDFEIEAHMSAGIYFIVVETKKSRVSSRFLVI